MTPFSLHSAAVQVAVGPRHAVWLASRPPELVGLHVLASEFQLGFAISQADRLE
jgi:hypothetical protein